jgi:serine/threonine protein kinase/tetratricopeptide (TPR) repeat protein
MADRIGHYRIVRQIGRGGMGIVYEAVDEVLHRTVAIKTILPSSDSLMRDRLIREARAAAAVSHPNICQLFEIGEHEGDPFLAMELLDGQALADRLETGPIPPDEAISIAISVLSALDALHRRSIIHRDLKPSNVFLSPHGVKLLDFGLARPVSLPRRDPSATAADGTIASDSDIAITQPGILLGTPRYMAPEQARGEEVDARTDLFAAGALLFEMLSGRPAFQGASPIEALHAVLHEHPPALVGSLAIVDADRVIQRAMMKSPLERYQTADDMRQDLRACLARGDLTGSIVARATTRLMVLPFRILRADPTIEYLAFSLPDAITVSLAGLESLVVRSSLAAARYASDQVDLRAVASEAAVDAVLTGTLLQAGGLVRVSVQLVEVPAGTVMWSQAFQVPLEEMFQIQDAVCAAVVEALALPLSSREQRMLHRDVPSSSEAYGDYLRANRLSNASSQWQLAREAYQRAVEGDPSYAPAWARYGRCLRIMGKYGQGAAAMDWRNQAETAFQRAFRINPDLSVAHNLYTYLEVENGRARDAVVRLLGRVRSRASDPELYAGLVHACRYAGLLEASVAAFERARHLDPSIRTSVAHTFYMLGDIERAIQLDADDPPYLTAVALVASGRREEAEALFRRAQARAPDNEHLLLVLDAVAAHVTKDASAGRAAVERLLAFPAFSDPEGLYYWAHTSAGLGDSDRALDLLARAVDTGLHCVRALEVPALRSALLATSRYEELIERTRALEHEAARAFADADGPHLLGLQAPSRSQH